MRKIMVIVVRSSFPLFVIPDASFFAICASMIYAQVLHEIHDGVHSALMPQVVQRREAPHVANKQCSGVGTKAGHDGIVAGKAIVASEDVKGREAMAIIGVVKSCFPAILDELSDVLSIYIRVDAQSK